MNENTTKNDIDISTVIPAYNAEKTIEICFNSVYNDLTASDYSFEIIIINDGSTDNTLQILEKIKESYDKFVHIINQENKGVSSARNAGLKIARGRYIAFCDSDDQWLEGKTVFSMKILEKSPNIKCFGGKFISKEKLSDDKKLGNIKKNRLKYITLNMQLFKSYFHPSTVILSKDIIIKNIIFNDNMKYGEDIEYFSRIVHKYLSAITYIPLKKSITDKYNFGESGLSSNLWEMEKGELYSIYLAYKNLSVCFFIFLTAVLYSMLRFTRRLIVVFTRRFRYIKAL